MRLLLKIAAVVAVIYIVYHDAVANPDVEVKVDGVTAEYTAVPVEGEEFRYLAEKNVKRRPNILIIVADDLGYSDVGFQGAQDIPTPSIDDLAARGVRLTSGYVSSTWCSPTRAGLLTGRYQQRFGEVGHERTPDSALSLQEATLADHLQEAGYVTGVIGKWHLGSSPDYHPLARGFDEFFGFLHGAHNFLPGVPTILFPDHNLEGEDYSATQQGRDRMDGQIMRGREIVEEPAYLTDAFAREAVAFIQRHQSDPFFLYLSFNAVHTPMQADDERLARFAHIEHPVRRVYNAMTVAMDEAVGDVVAQLRRSGIDENTLVFFISDNGGPTVLRYAYNASDNTPLRGSKGTTLEGGIRVPFVVTWPDVLPPGTQFDQPIIQLDIMPTVLAAAGIGLPSDLDGTNIIPQLSGEDPEPPHAALFWRSFGQMAVRQGDWKLVTYPALIDEGELPRGLDRDAGPLTAPRLYNLRDDVGETTDLAAAEPELAARLQTLWNTWNGEMRPVTQPGN
jgi:arylsulfatase A-like enzyme